MSEEPKELSRFEYVQAKIKEGIDLDRWLAYWRFRNEKIVFTNGCFDLLHPGHVEYLYKAAELGTVLIVGLNTDESVKRLKGTGRPVQDQESRALVLAALECIDAVVLFDQDTPAELIAKIQPDVLVKGQDYKPEEIAGADIVKAKGGEVVCLPLREGCSSTSLIEKSGC